MERIKVFFLEGVGLFSLVDWLLFGGCFVVFVLLYFLACLLRNVRFFIPQFFKLLAFCVFFASPVGVYWVNQNILYKNEVHYSFVKEFEYSPTFFVDAKIKNIGSREIKQCIFVLEVLREEKGLRDKILNYLKPIKMLTYRIDGTIGVNQSKAFSHTFNHFDDPIYQYRVFCYGGSK